MFRECILALAITLSFASAGQAENAVRSRIAEARQQLNYSSAQFQYQRLVTSSLIHLFEQGYASRQEVMEAEAAQAALKAKRVQDKKTLTAVRAMCDSMTLVKQSSSPGAMIVEIPGLRHRPETIGLELVIPVAADTMSELSQHQVESSATTSAATAARQKLLNRLARLGVNRETELAQLKHQMSQAADQADRYRRPAIWISHPATVVAETDGLQKSEHQVIRKIERLAARSQMIADKRAIQADVQMLSQLHHAVQQAHDGAAPTELDTIAQKLRMAELRTRKIDERITALDRLSNDVIMTANDDQDVRLAAELFGRRVSRQELNTAIGAVHEQLLQAIAAKRHAGQLARQMTEQLTKIGGLAARDSFFSNEWNSLKREQQVANAELQVATVELMQLQDVFEFLSCLRDVDQRSNDWKASLVRIFERQADAGVAIAALTATRHCDSHRHSALQQLQKGGHATWMETTAANVRLAITQQRFAHEQREADLYSAMLPQIQKFLDDVDRRSENDTVVLAD